MAIEPLPGITERNPPCPAIKQGNTKFFFERRDSLTHGRLCDTQVGRGGGKAPTLRNQSERRKVWKLLEVRGSRGFDHVQNALEYDATRATYPGRRGWSVGSVMVVVHPPERGISLNRSGLCECRSQ